MLLSLPFASRHEDVSISTLDLQELQALVVHVALKQYMLMQTDIQIGTLFFPSGRTRNPIVPSSSAWSQLPRNYGKFL